jgi:hypothetical protein
VGGAPGLRAAIMTRSAIHCFGKAGSRVRSIEPINLTVFRSPRCDQVGILKLDSTSVQFGVFILFTRIPSVAELVASADGSVDTDMMNLRLK